MEFLGFLFLGLLAVSLWATIKSLRAVFASKEDLARMAASTGTSNTTMSRVVAVIALAIFAPILVAQVGFLVVAGYQMASR